MQDAGSRQERNSLENAKLSSTPLEAVHNEMRQQAAGVHRTGRTQHGRNPHVG